MSLHSQRYCATALVLLLALGAVSVHSSAVTVEPGATTRQVAGPFSEMAPGVYLYWHWWNESSDDWNYTYSYRGDWLYYHSLYDIYNNTYLIEVRGSGEYEFRWEFTNLLVSIIVDPDASYVRWLGTTSSELDIWTIYWNPQLDALTGDEVFVYSGFYYDYWYSHWAYSENYTWYDTNWQTVDPYLVMPRLSDEYSWAPYYVEPQEYMGNSEYRSFGFDVNEMLLQQNRIERMNHYFAGLSVFNDSNSNGIMDMVYSEFPVDYDLDGVPDYVYQVLNSTLSELVFDFYPSSASLGEVVTPHINDNGQLEWSAEVVNITGMLSRGSPVVYLVDVLESGRGSYLGFQGFAEIPASLESMKLTYRFEVSQEAITLKIDQYLGNFVDPITGNILPELHGLGLSVNYWSSFSSADLQPLTWNSTEPTQNESRPDAPLLTDSTRAIDIPGGTLVFDSMSRPFLDIQFGGTYVWGGDGGTYPVGTAVYPGYAYGQADLAAPASSELTGEYGWSSVSYYYSSCYAKWSGHSIAHDPVYIAYPRVSPGTVWSFVNTVIVISFAIGSLGIIVIRVAYVRARNSRLQ
ncbi:MAG: hypothetical protein QXS20_07420 [Candidatus Thorarchaeota archaeon]